VKEKYGGLRLYWDPTDIDVASERQAATEAEALVNHEALTASFS
jgi:hypothetical protein